MRRTLYMNGPLIELAEEIKNNESAGWSFSGRLGTIVERYKIIMELETIAFTNEELAIASEAVCGSVINARKIRGLHLDMLDLTTSDEMRKKLHDKVKAMTPAQRMLLVERMGQ